MAWGGQPVKAVSLDREYGTGPLRVRWWGRAGSARSPVFDDVNAHGVFRPRPARLSYLAGKTNGRYRLDRGGNRQANAALYHAIIVRMR